MVCVPPTRSISFSCSTRSSFTCRSSDSSPTSSRKIVPWCASSKRPFFCWSAPVNAPRSWPNSSLSARLAGSAPQLTLIAPPAHLVDRTRDELLARAGFAEQQHRGVGARHERDVAEDLPHRPARADNLAELPLDAQLLAEIDVLALERLGPLALGDVARDEQRGWRGSRAEVDRRGPSFEPPLPGRHLELVLEHLELPAGDRAPHDLQKLVRDRPGHDVVEAASSEHRRVADEQLVRAGQNLQVPSLVIDDKHEVGQRLRDGEHALLAALQVGGALGHARLELRGMPLHPLAQPRLANGHRQDAGQLAGHRHLLGVHRSAVREADREGADEIALGQQRHGDARAEPFVPQHRGARIVVGDLLEHADLARPQIVNRPEAVERDVGARRRRGEARRRVRREKRARRSPLFEDREIGAAARHEIGQTPERRLRDARRRARRQDVAKDRVSVLQPPVELAKALLGVASFGDVALDAEVPGEASLGVVEADVIAFNPDLRAVVEAAFLGFDPELAPVEEVAPEAASVGHVVPVEVAGPQTDELLARRPVLGEHRLVHLGDALMLEDVIEGRVLVGGVVPADRLVEHHEEDAVERLREEERQAVVRLGHQTSGRTERRC
jgi:glutaredoxin